MEVLKHARVIDVGERKIVRVAKNYNYKGKPRFIINLPTTRNDVWNTLWEMRIPIKVYIEIPEGAIKEDEEDQEGDQK